MSKYWNDYHTRGPVWVEDVGGMKILGISIENIIDTTSDNDKPLTEWMNNFTETTFIGYIGII